MKTEHEIPIAIRLSWVEKYGEDEIEVWVVEVQLKRGCFWHELTVLDIEQFGPLAESMARVAGQSLAASLKLPLIEKRWPHILEDAA